MFPSAKAACTHTELPQHPIAPVLSSAVCCFQVSDIKRANGILSDNAMFAREHVKIPTGSLPLRYGHCSHNLYVVHVCEALCTLLHVCEVLLFHLASSRPGSWCVGTVWRVVAPGLGLVSHTIVLCCTAA